MRKLGIPTVTDRVIQQAITQVLTPMFDAAFSESSFGFRPGRSAHDAARQALRHQEAGKQWVVGLDLKQFFDEVGHDVLMGRLGRKVKDKRLKRLVNAYLKAGVRVDGCVHPTLKGTPQGGPLSPLLSNVLLDGLDKELERRIRETLNPVLRGWMQYFRIGTSQKTLGSYDFWIRRHLRCMLWRQWKTPATRFKRLLEMGCPKHQALLAYSRRGPWGCAGVPALTQFLPPPYFRQMGLYSLLKTAGMVNNINLGTAGCGPASPVV